MMSRRLGNCYIWLFCSCRSVPRSVPPGMSPSRNLIKVRMWSGNSGQSRMEALVQRGPANADKALGLESVQRGLSHSSLLLEAGSGGGSNARQSEEGYSWGEYLVRSQGRSKGLPCLTHFSAISQDYNGILTVWTTGVFCLIGQLESIRKKY